METSLSTSNVQIFHPVSETEVDNLESTSTDTPGSIFVVPADLPVVGRPKSRTRENHEVCASYEWLSLNYIITTTTPNHKSAQQKTLKRQNTDTSGDSFETSYCRICWSGNKIEKLLQPCRCSSSVHLSCIQKWLQVSNSRQCEVCMFQYQTKRLFKPLRQWTWHKCIWPVGPFDIILIILTLIVIPVIVGAVVWTQNLQHLTDASENPWKTAGLIILVVTSLVTYLFAIIYCCLKCRLRCKGWLESNSENVIVIGGHHINLQSLQNYGCLYDLGLEVATGEDNGSIWTLS